MQVYLCTWSRCINYTLARWCWCRNTSISTNTRRLLVIVACELRDKPANLCFEVRTGPVLVEGSDSWLMDTADTKFWISDSLLHLVHQIMANGHRDRRHEEQWRNKIEDAVFHHLVSCVHQIVGNGQLRLTLRDRAIDKNGSTINNLSHKKLFNYFQIETSMMDK